VQPCIFGLIDNAHATGLDPVVPDPVPRRQLDFNPCLQVGYLRKGWRFKEGFGL
jgi:hypothetical protein